LTIERTDLAYIEIGSNKQTLTLKMALKCFRKGIVPIKHKMSLVMVKRICTEKGGGARGQGSNISEVVFQFLTVPEGGRLSLVLSRSRTKCGLIRVRRLSIRLIHKRDNRQFESFLREGVLRSVSPRWKLGRLNIFVFNQFSELESWAQDSIKLKEKLQYIQLCGASGNLYGYKCHWGLSNRA